MIPTKTKRACWLVREGWECSVKKHFNNGRNRENHTWSKTFWTVYVLTNLVTNNNYILHDRPRVSRWIKSISNELDVVIHVFASQLSGHCDVISNRLWRHQQSENWVSETRERCPKIVVLSLFMDSFCCVRNKIMYVLSRRTISAPTRVLFWCLFPSLLRNSGNKHQNNPLMIAETVRHSSTYIILYKLSLSSSKCLRGCTYRSRFFLVWCRWIYFRITKCVYKIWQLSQ